MRRECRECGKVFPTHRLHRKPLVSDPGMHHGTCVTHVPWCMSGSLTCGGGEKVPGIPGACAPVILRICQEAHTLCHRTFLSPSSVAVTADGPNMWRLFPWYGAPCCYKPLSWRHHVLAWHHRFLTDHSHGILFFLQSYMKDDKNKDSKIDFEEFKAGVTSFGLFW